MISSPLRTLAVVTSELPEPPYPNDVRANGWRFELHVERLENSDTWTVTPADMRPWLLMLWMRSWTQSPCGSLPANDEIIAARIGMDARAFQANRHLLMSGWYLASDGRLYHPVITELVERMRDGRRTEREKKARQRHEKNQALGKNVPGDYQGSPPTGTGTGVEITTVPAKAVTVVVDGGAADPDLLGDRTPIKDAWRGVARECPHQKIVALYHELFPAGPTVSKWDDRRQSYSRARWREEAEANKWQDEKAGLQWFAKFFRYAARSAFLTGRVDPRNKDGKPFLASLEWLLRPTNFRNVVEGKYE